jgi:cardiolipin synthase (CMP-forming)
MQLTFRGESILNVPNIISFYRLATFPAILAFALLGYEKPFVILLCINLVSDIIDGFIARRFNLVTRFGAALDNLADIGTYFLALFGLFTFKWAQVQPHAWFLYLFLAIFVLSYVVAFLRLGKIPGLHLYSAVSAGYIQGTFFFVLFVWEFNLLFYYVAIGWGIIAYIEKTVVLLKLNEIRPGVKGLYWLIKDQKYNPSERRQRSSNTK